VANANQRTVAVTGAGSGLGRDIALGLAAKNYRVFGTAFTPEEIEDLNQASSGVVTLAICDITDAAAVKNWAHDIATQTEGSLDLLINNAGILTPGPLEILPLDAIRHEFEVNVFGALSVMNAFLASASEGSRPHRPDQYLDRESTTSFQRAVRSIESGYRVFAAVYRAELKHLGVDVVVAPAGNMRTGGPAKTAAALARVADDMTPEQRELYGQTFATFANGLNVMQNSGLDSVSAASRVIEIAEQVPCAKPRAYRRRRGRDASVRS